MIIERHGGWLTCVLAVTAALLIAIAKCGSSDSN